MKNWLILSGLIFAPLCMSHGALLVNGNFASGSLGATSQNDTLYQHVDQGWIIKSGWNISGGNAVNSDPQTDADMRRALTQVNTVSIESGNQLTLTLDWTAPAGATGDALNMTYQVVGWKVTGTPTTGNKFFAFINSKPGYSASGLSGNATTVDLLDGSTSTGDNVAQSFGTFTGTAGVSSPVTVNVDLSGYGAGLDNVSNYDYIGIRLATGTDATSELINGSIIDNVTLTASNLEQAPAITSYDTGYTISKVRTVETGATNFILASSYEGTLLGMDYDGTALWTNELSGFMNRDLWCDDLTGDGNDEILAANADGSIYCLDSDGVLQWTFKTNDAPMNAVCVVHSNATPFVVCGGYDLNYYYLTASGAAVKTIASSTYSKDKAWAGITTDRPPDYVHTANFIRPFYTNGVEMLAVNGVLNTHQDSGTIYLFEVLADLPYQTNDVFQGMRVGDFRPYDPDGDGVDEIMMGASVNRGDGRIVKYDPVTGSQFEFNIYSNFNAECGAGYRVAQVETIPDGSGGFEYLILYGSNIILAPEDLNPANSTVLTTRHAFNDLWKDSANPNRIIMASAQSGGSCIHLIDTSDSNWKAEYASLTPPGKIATILANTDLVITNLASFTKPVWERAQTPVYLTTEKTDGLEAYVSSLTNTYASPVFLNSYFEPDVQSTNWRSVIANDVYREKQDSRRNYVLTQNEVLNGTTGVAGMLNQYDGHPGMSTWGGHGNDPYFFEHSTLTAIIDGATNSAVGGFKKTVLTWPEMNGSDTNFAYVMDDLFYPLAGYASNRNANIYVRNKNTFWLASVYLEPWSRLVAGEFPGVFVPSMEETSDKTQDASIAGRMGIWASGAVDSWGTRVVPDNASYDRLRQFSTQRLPNHFLRMLVYHLSSGAQYLNNFAVDQDYLSVYWELIAKGVIFVPHPDEIVSFNPVHLSMTDPDHDFIVRAENNKWTTFYDEAWLSTNKMILNRMNGTWPGAPLAEWDFSNYASGVNERRLEFLPSYNNGMVLITPPQDGVFADTNAVRGALKDNLHPLYKNIMQEFITDGRNYYSGDGLTTYSAETYYTTVSNAIAASASLLPLTVSGDAAWVCAQTDDKHLRLTLIDGGYINPKGATVTVQFHTADPVSMTDLLTGEMFVISNSTALVDIPLGLFRFIDIELAATPGAPATIVQWGESGGATNIVSAPQDFSSSVTTYTAGNIASPAVGASYYPDSAGRTPVFNHASTNASNVKRISDGGSGADFITTARNFSNYNAMVVWEYANFLSSNDELSSMEIETRVNNSNSTQSQFRWLIQKDGSSWYASAETDTSSSYALYSTSDPGSLTWYDFTPFNSGVASVGAEATIDMTGITAVGYYATIQQQFATNKYRASETRYFKAVAGSGATPLTGWDAYIAAYGLAGGVTNDADSDGETDLYEYALGGNPTNPAILGVVPYMVYGAGDVVRYYNWQVNATNPGISYVAEWTDNLVSNVWSSSWDAESSLPTTNAAYDEAERQIYGGTNDNLFIRLKVLQP